MAKTKKKRTFLAIFLGTPASMKKFMKLPAKIRRAREREGIEAWYAWVGKYERSIVYPGAPLGPTKRIDRKGITNTHNELGAFVVVQANSHADAAKIFRNHPHFMIFPGEAVEVMECLEIPKL